MNWNINDGNAKLICGVILTPPDIFANISQTTRKYLCNSFK